MDDSRVLFGGEQPPPPDLRVVGEVDEADMGQRKSDLWWRHHAQAREAWIGALVLHFDNDELRVLADSLSVADCDDLRKLGLIAADEGWDGTKEGRKRVEARAKARREARKAEAKS